MIKQLGGHIEVESESGKGTRFALFFPICDDDVTPTRAATIDVRFSGTALLVEDEPLVRLTVRRALEELGMTVLEARNAVEAQQLSARHSIAVLVTDVVLPVMRGPKLANLLRARNPALRVLFISANPGFSSDELASVERTAVLQKPFRHDELAAQLSTLFQADRPPAPHATDIPQRTTAGARILIVEDQAVARMALVHVLEDMGYNVRAAARASEALSTIRECDGAIDVVLTDVHLPDMNGEDLAAHLATMLSPSQIVFMSGMADPPASGAAFVSKPIDFSTLVEVIERALAVTASSPSA